MLLDIFKINLKFCSMENSIITEGVEAFQEMKTDVGREEVKRGVLEKLSEEDSIEFLNRIKETQTV